jgi:hypothetical protein
MSDGASTPATAAEASATKQPAWPAAIASLALSALSLFLLYLYGKIHWRVLFDHYREMSEELRRLTLEVLNGLEVYRIVALLALMFSVWAFRGRPRWIAWIALPIALLAAMSALIIQ